MKKKLLFLIPSLHHGGAEKVLVNLVNNLDSSKYDITVQTLFDVGVHRESLKPHIRYLGGMKRQFRGNTTFFKLFSPKFLWKRLVGEHYDIAISYLEGPTSRILGGCTDPDTKTVAWIHTGMEQNRVFSVGFRSVNEARNIYSSFDRVIAVSEGVKKAFSEHCPRPHLRVLYNTNETEQILEKAMLEPENAQFDTTLPCICSVGKLIPIKGFDRLLNVHKRLLNEGLNHRIYILGLGAEQKALEKQMQELGIEHSVTLLGFHKNPYQYVSRCDLYVCSSHREGFSTAVTEALVVGTPAVSTCCSGATELLGEHNEYGIVVENTEEGIYQGMKRLLSDPALLAHYKEKAKERGSFFSRTATVQAVEEMLDML